MPSSVSTLKAAFADDFIIGTTLSTAQIRGENPEAIELGIKEFNGISPENIMKWMHIHPGSNEFSFDLPDKFVQFGEDHDMYILAHNLVWHSQLAPWVKEVQTAEEMTEVLEHHITTIVSRYKGRVDAWDVINEALNEDGTLRKTIFLETLGPDYLATAFDLAAKADPKVSLYYNDYNLTDTEKRAGCVALVKQLQEEGVKIDGVGLQAHWNLNTPSLEEIEESILAYSALGVKLSFTELDITVLPNPWDFKGAGVEQNFENDPKMNPYPQTLPDSIEAQLAQRYQSIFNLFLKHKDKIERVTFWGMSDGNTWLNNWPIKGRTNHPLLFDRAYQPKKAYHSVMQLKNKEGKT